MSMYAVTNDIGRGECTLATPDPKAPKEPINDLVTQIFCIINEVEDSSNRIASYIMDKSSSPVVEKDPPRPEDLWSKLWEQRIQLAKTANTLHAVLDILGI